MIAKIGSKAPGGPADDRARQERGNIVRLAVAQALAGANSTVAYATGAVVGNMLAPSKALATLPISIFVVGMALSTLPTGMIARRHGRRAAFLIGTFCGVLVGVLAATAVVLGSFWLFCAAMFFGGIYAAVVMTFRFAAADGISPERRPRALAAVMSGGIVAGVLGPQLVTLTMDVLPPYTFAVTYLAQAGVAMASALVLLGVNLPTTPSDPTSPGRPLATIARSPKFVAAVICGVVSYMMMNFVMTSAPLAMRLCGLSQESANLGLQWHVVAMYAPSFFTGRLIERFGADTIVLIGLALIAASAGVGLLGIEVSHFTAALILLGVGWNFGFVGASALVLQCHRPEERTQVQALNDFLVFGMMVVGSFSSGGILASGGWSAVCLVTFPPLIVAVAALLVTKARATAAATNATDR